MDRYTFEQIASAMALMDEYASDLWHSDGDARHPRYPNPFYYVERIIETLADKSV